ncbi:type 11 methyltransferase [Salinarchaeum sp. Harcht-Bsk1]|uniref:class I SAM-dependent methyltransferase n=1 Tax=Salinarchaeum sp. Harcht-Bsk1 TaxID=1333523 RepID=UPI0003424505|nr:methyltransferase domain-containing protein [Salinarchaeum sp. Harcht-Bsk1]AGN02463.1 type 11 methyltransferase [Salinarchaeum sp. Harcht-Bsk1]
MAEDGAVDNEWEADRYEADHAFVYESSQDLVELLDPAPGERIADLGCGTGHLTAAIAREVDHPDGGPSGHAIGFDRSASMVAEARSSYPAVEFLQADARSLPFDATVDAVFSNAALHWISDQEAVVSSIHDALRPGGRLVAELGGVGNVATITDALEAELVERGSPGQHGWYFPSPGEYATLLEAGGFEVRDLRLFDRPTPLDGADGLEHWIEGFGDELLDPLSDDERSAVIEAVEDRCRTDLWTGEEWVADYRRLRVVAVSQ